MSAGGAGARAGFLVYRRGKASAGGGVVGVPLGGRRTGSGVAGCGGFSRVTGGSPVLLVLLVRAGGRGKRRFTRG